MAMRSYIEATSSFCRVERTGALQGEQHARSTTHASGLEGAGRWLYNLNTIRRAQAHSRAHSVVYHRRADHRSESAQYPAYLQHPHAEVRGASRTAGKFGIIPTIRRHPLSGHEHAAA